MLWWHQGSCFALPSRVVKAKRASPPAASRGRSGGPERRPRVEKKNAPHSAAARAAETG